MQNKISLIFLLTLCFLHNSVTAQRVGINVANPKAALHVSDSSVVFTAPDNLPLSASIPPITSTGVRMMWYADRAAFRAGEVTNQFIWTKDVIAPYSFSFGKNVNAMKAIVPSSPSYSFAAGDSSFTFCNSCVSIGKGNYVTSDFGASFGRNNFGGGYSFGQENVIFGALGFATGFKNEASNILTFAGGSNTKANSIYASAFGYNTIANGYGSMAIGMYNDSITAYQGTSQSTTPLFMIGNGTWTNLRNNAFTVLKNGKIGINEKSPQAALHLKAIESTENAHIRLENFTNNNYASIYYLQNGLNFKINNNLPYVWIDKEDKTKMKMSTNGQLFMVGKISSKEIVYHSPQTIFLTSDNQIVNAGENSYTKIASNTTTATSRTIVLSNGISIGQKLIIEGKDNSFEINETSSNVNLSTTSIIMGMEDVIELKWNGIDWLQTAYSNN